MIGGINHITFSVKNLEKSFQFYKDILGFAPLMKHGKGAYFLAGDLWFCLEHDINARKSALPEDTHIAFSVEQSQFEKISQFIRSSGAEIWKENESEGDSIYFLDPDGHKLEVHVGDWRSRLRDAKERPWSEDMEFFI